jgi:hypothetical protein
MTFDAELKRTFEALGDRLHAELQHQIDAAMAELRAASTAGDVAAPSAPRETEDRASLVDGIRAIDDARSLTDILDAFAGAAARHAVATAVRLRRDGRWQTWRAFGVDENRDAADALRLPIAISGETIGELYAEGADEASLEILTRHAARSLESVTAFKTARALARQANAPDTAHATDEEASAQRYARLLVSEIKLYHESDAAAGRRERDLATRLGGEIARARVLYDQRVPPHVRQRADYFRDELVRTLANGDAALLEVRT